MLVCPECKNHTFNIWFRQVVCLEYDSSMPGDEWDKETLVETEALVAIECDRCGTDLSKYRQFVRLFARGTRDKFKPLK